MDREDREDRVDRVDRHATYAGERTLDFHTLCFALLHFTSRARNPMRRFQCEYDLTRKELKHPSSPLELVLLQRPDIPISGMGEKK